MFAAEDARLDLPATVAAPEQNWRPVLSVPWRTAMLIYWRGPSSGSTVAGASTRPFSFGRPIRSTPAKQSVVTVAPGGVGVAGIQFHSSLLLLLMASPVHAYPVARDGCLKKANEMASMSVPGICTWIWSGVKRPERHGREDVADALVVLEPPPRPTVDDVYPGR